MGDLIIYMGDFLINPFASPCAGAPALKYGYVNTVTPSPGEVKGLIEPKFLLFNNSITKLSLTL